MRSLMSLCIHLKRQGSFLGVGNKCQTLHCGHQAVPTGHNPTSIHCFSSHQRVRNNATSPQAVFQERARKHDAEAEFSPKRQSKRSIMSRPVPLTQWEAQSVFCYQRTPRREQVLGMESGGNPSMCQMWDHKQRCESCACPARSSDQTHRCAMVWLTVFLLYHQKIALFLKQCSSYYQHFQFQV